MLAANRRPGREHSHARADTRPRCRSGFWLTAKRWTAGHPLGTLLWQPVATGATSRSGPCGEARGASRSYWSILHSRA